MLSIQPIKAFSDNYIWLITTNEGSLVVDPGDASAVIEYVESKNIDIKGILITHHHFDHTGGIVDLKKKYELDVFGPFNEVDGIDHRVNGGDTVSAIGIDFQVIDVPGHTLDHIAFFSENKGDPVLFCGDTLFSGGCGRVFEGTFEQMFLSVKRLSELPSNTKMYCGHEYTISNLKFAKEVLPSDNFIDNAFKEVEKKINNGIPSLPTTLEYEKLINPFLKFNDDEVIASITNKFNVSNDPNEIFTAMRKWKDNF
ncbi:MAG: hydroxyacylglutathione hydrolase [Gammaproteobacteria bacterium]|nr:hydroxyacylglutathione hydrolase [Gammaproteobacteria bacterium]|tara:strand:+ start:275 stop:1039 length:765 start_codon:yes stop_codon:yes gene_type:complete